MSRLNNVLEMLHLLSSGRVYSLSELADRFEVDRRTIQRMKDDLLDLEYDIETIKGPGGGYKLVSMGKKIEVSSYLSEKQNIIKGLTHLTTLDETSFGPNFKRDISKLLFDFAKDAEPINTEVINTTRLNIDFDTYFDHINIFQDAIKNHKRLKVEYGRLYGDTKEYYFEPYELFVLNQVWYVAGYNKEDRQVNLRLTRVKGIEDLRSQYRFDKDMAKALDIPSHGYEINPVNLKLKVLGNPYYYEYIWGQNQVVEMNEDKTYILSVDFPNDLAAKSFVLSGGQEFIVLEPKSLRDWIQKELKTMLNNYEV